VILAHYQTAHTVAPNISPDIRYCVYFRVTAGTRPDKMQFFPDAMQNIWLEYEGLQHLL